MSLPHTFSNSIGSVPLSYLDDNFGALSGTTGGSYVGYTAPFTGAANRTVTAKFSEIVSLTDFAGADPTGGSDSTAAINAAIAALSGTVGALYVPAGTFSHASTIVWKNKIKVIGAGNRISNFLYTGTSDGHQINNPSNSNTIAAVHFEDVGFAATTATAGKCNFVDNGSTYLAFQRCKFNGNMIGLALDQTEIWKVEDCEFLGVSNSASIGLWLINGPDRTIGNSTGYTNNGTVSGCEFSNATGYGIAIVDDGGLAHTFTNSNNFSGWTNQFRFAGTSGLYFGDAEMEFASLANIVANSTTLSGTSIGQPQGMISNNTIIAAAGQSGLAIVNGGNLQTLCNTISNASSMDTTPSIAITACISLIRFGDVLKNAPSGTATYGFSRDVFSDASTRISGAPLILSGATLNLSESATAPALASNGTITTAATGTSRVAPAAAVTGVILQAGTVAGQVVTVINQSTSANSITFAASGTSNVADGTSAILAGLRSMVFAWDSVTSLWYRS